MIPAKDDDWGTNDGSKIDRETNFVLAKGGIKIKDAFYKTEQNLEVVKMFLQREPDHFINIETGVGIRDMLVYGNDFVDRTLTRRLSMEFDWKRQPHYAGETDVEFDDIHQKHLFFSTRPWRSIEEFVKSGNPMSKKIENA